MTKQIDVAVLPSEIEALPADCYVVVDVLRATTTIATLFENGLTDLIVTGDLALAREIAARDSRILCGEVYGLPPEGFDIGNSPCEARAANVAGRGAVLYTTNGTPTLCAVAQKGVCFAGALANISAVAQAVTGYEHVVIVCAGNAGGRRFAQEDFAVAGSFVRAIMRLDSAADTGDAAAIAMGLTGYDDWLRAGLPQQTATSPRLIGGSEHARKTIELGFAADVQFAMQPNTSTAVPIVTATGDGWARISRAGG